MYTVWCSVWVSVAQLSIMAAAAQNSPTVDAKLIADELASYASAISSNTRNKYADVFHKAEERVNQFQSLDDYAEERVKMRAAFDKIVMHGIYHPMQAKLDAELAEGKEVPLAVLPQPVITGSVAHGTSYADSDVDFAWVVDTLQQLQYVRSLFKAVFSDPANAKTGAKGTVVEKAAFFMGFDFTTKAGLPWVPFMLHGVKFDQTFRLAAQHRVIEAAAQAGYAAKFKTGVDQLAYMKRQHVLQILKSKFSAIATDAKSDEAKTLAAAYEALYMAGKAAMTPDAATLAAAGKEPAPKVPSVDIKSPPAATVATVSVFTLCCAVVVAAAAGFLLGRK